MYLKVFDCDSNSGSQIEMNELIARITAYNTDAKYGFELLKAFAVMARTELARKTFIYGGKGCENHKGYDLCTEPGHCLEYGLSKVAVPESVYDAVKATGNMILLFEGKPIKPYFHYRCGGATENSENVLGNRVTYLRRVLCSFCKDISDDNSDKYFTVDELEELLKTRFKKPDGIYYNIQGMFEDMEVDEQGKISRLKIGSKVFKGTELMNVLKLNSTRFDYVPVKFLIKCIGMGHGLGLCQCGANEMAKSGRSFDEILRYYFTGVKIGEMEMPESNKPLKGTRLVLDAAYGGEGCSGNAAPVASYEKDINLDIVMKLRRLLSDDGAEVYLTRDSNVGMVLSDRASISNDKRPDFFLSVGQNSFQNSSATGTEIYYYRGDSEGEKLAKLIIEETSKSFGLKNRGIRNADFYLLREVKASAVIIQLLYISNPDDERLLLDENFRSSAAEAIYKAIRKYYKSIQ
ncbi:MAG: N-acetylmuramoyl-L-alanine amidase [Caulobacteraceae bacterium]